MNVEFTSVYVGKESMDTPSRRLTTSEELPLQIEPQWVMDSETDALDSILRTSVTGITTPFEFQDSCKCTTKTTRMDTNSGGGIRPTMWTVMGQRV